MGARSAVTPPTLTRQLPLPTSTLSQQVPLKRLDHLDHQPALRRQAPLRRQALMARQARPEVQESSFLWLVFLWQVAWVLWHSCCEDKMGPAGKSIQAKRLWNCITVRDQVDIDL